MSKRVLYLILVVGALLRLYNLDHGLPAIYEEATPMRQAWEMWDNGHLDLNPHFFHYPALYFYLQFIVQILYFIINLVAGRFTSFADMATLYASDPTELVLIARILNVLFGLGTIWATYRLGCVLRTPNLGLIGAAIIAILPLTVHSSRIILVDTPLLFFATLSLIASILLIQQNDYKHNILAGVWIGLAGASKYTGALFLIPFLIAHICRNKSICNMMHHKKQIATGIATSAITFLITNPYILLDFETFWTDFSFERTHMALGHFGVDPNRTLITYVQDLWYNYAMTLIPFLLWGLFTTIKNIHAHPTFLPLLVFAGIYLGLISTWSMNAAHYLLPVFPILSLLTGCGILNLLEAIKKPTKIAVPIALIIIAPASIHTLQNHANNKRPDTRAIAKTWIEEHLPHASLIAQEHYTPDLSEKTYHLLRIPMDTVRPELVTPFYDLTWYKDFDYIITSTGVSERYQNRPDQFPTQNQFYAQLQSQWHLLISFSGDDFSGPAIHIYQNTSATKASPDTFSSHQYQTLNGFSSHVVTDLLRTLGNLYAQKKWLPQAIDIYRHLLNINPSDTQAYQVLGMLFFQTDQIENALKAWEKSLQTDPQNVALLTNLGALYLQQGNTQQAIQYWEKGFQLAPKDRDLINNLVFVYKQIGQTERARAVLQKALQAYPNDPAFQAPLRELTP